MDRHRIAALVKRIASIDIGTNTILMLVADVADDGSFSVVRDEHTIARLGRGVDSSRRINSDAIERVISCLVEYARLARADGVSHIVACGTSALRDAANREEVLSVVRSRTGLDIRILTGGEEAQLTYVGAISGTTEPKSQRPFGVIDIGGGSTEVTFGSGLKVQFSKSVDIGSVRLTERWWTSYPPHPNNIADARNEIRAAVESIESHHKELTWVGVAGTLTTCAAIDLKLQSFDRNAVDGHILKRETVTGILEDLLTLSLEELHHHRQILPERGDIIGAGVLILDEIMSHLKLEKITVSDRGLRYGVLMEAVGAIGPTSKDVGT